MLNIVLVAVACSIMIAMMEYIKHYIRRCYKTQFDAYRNPEQKGK